MPDQPNIVFILTDQQRLDTIAASQLFDLDKDPGERVNLWDRADHADRKRDLIDQILTWRIQSARQTQGFVQLLANRGR